ncbi:11963_t:CDS:10 [Ambispora leptoticha]|uniref:11963_t:CDS:1 n=1 Tax=Ambispora leptoticha TaxID=144679 RepID=A0A9N9AJV1_9GLOM|nr:11963_t:CDS:10 [Ambispora leptoticha]
MPNELSHPYRIPEVTVQSDWVEVVSDVARRVVGSESFWVSCYKKGAVSVHGSVKVLNVSDDPSSVEFIGKDGVDVEKIDNYSFYLSCNAMELSRVIIKGAKSTLKNIHETKMITAMDISPGGRLFVTGDNKGILKVGDTSDGSVRRELLGHVLDISTCRFFPSGQVILSGSGDFQLRIWSALDGSNPVTLKGHIKGVTDTAIIDRGRNILSASRDGTIKLWDCGSSSTLSTMGHYESSVDKISLGTFIHDLPYTRNSDYQLDSREVATQDKIVVGALGSGAVIGIDLRSKKEIFSADSYRNVSLCSCAYSPNRNLIIAGSSQGVIELFDIRDLSKNLSTFQRNEAAVNDLLFIEGSSDFLVAQGDGSAYRISGISITQATHEYIGFDIDPVCSIRAIDNGREVYAAGRDGCLRNY